MAHKSVADAYNGKTVFITGATGFLGKVILEKLLYSCPGIEKVYILVREKEHEDTNQRIRKLLEQPLFSRLREENPSALENIVPIYGDISKPNLGLTNGDEQHLIDTVSIVFHAAASIKFNEPFEVAMNINVAGTGRVLNLCRRLKNVEAFVYVSTAYSNTNREVINEVIYPPPASLNEVMKLIELGITEDQVKELLKGRPNTYTFTKAMAENLVAENHEHVPAVIIRPSIISASDAEPLVGWIDNWFGATSLMISIAKGLYRALLADPNNAIDLIPVDYVSNLTITAAAKCKSSKDVQVYNITTSGENPLVLRNFKEIVRKYTNRNGFHIIPMVVFTKNKWLVTIITVLLQIIPACISDLILLLTGNKPRYRRNHAKLILAREKMEYFTSNTWKICALQTKCLYDSLTDSDQRAFPFDPTSINWNTYIPKYLQGIETFLCKP